MMLAAQAGHFEIVQLLNNAGAKLAGRADDDCTTLLMTANQGHAEVVRFLFDAGAKLADSKYGVHGVDAGC